MNNKLTRYWRYGYSPLSLFLCGLPLLLTGCGGGGHDSSKPNTLQSYSITDLGVLPGGTSSSAAALNNKGEVVGTATQASNSGGSEQAFLWKNGIMTGLGMLPGGKQSRAVGINDTEQVCGNSDTSVGQQGFLYENGTITGIDPLPGDEGVAAVALNASGQVVLSSYPPGPPRQPNSYGVLPSRIEIYSKGGSTEIEVPSGDVAIVPDAINATGQIVGASINENKLSRAFVSQGGSVSFLGTLPSDSSSEAVAINAGSQMVGYSAIKTGTNDAGGQNPTFAYHAVLFTNGKVVSLGALPGDTDSAAEGINDSGQIIGASNGPLASNSDIQDYLKIQHPFLYTNGAMIDLRSRIPANSGWIIFSVSGINNAGQICGTGQHNGQFRAFLLTPQ